MGRIETVCGTEELQVGGGVRLACHTWRSEELAGDVTGERHAGATGAGFVEREPASAAGIASPTARPRAVLAVVHGYGEHGGRYGNLAGAMVPRGYVVASFDHRGHGRSPGRRGHIDRFSSYVADTRAFLEELRERHADLPVILVGHSMGGLVAAALAEDDDAGLSALVLSSPLFGLRLEVSALQRRAARLLSAVAPTVPLDNPLRNEDLSRDPEVVAAATADPLNHRKTTVRWGAEAMVAMTRTVEASGSLRVPLLLLVAGGDRIADPARSEAFFAGAGSEDKTMLLYDGFYHELFNELDRGRVFGDLSRWLDERLPETDGERG